MNNTQVTPMCPNFNSFNSNFKCFEDLLHPIEQFPLLGESIEQIEELTLKPSRVTRGLSEQKWVTRQI